MESKIIYWRIFNPQAKSFFGPSKANEPATLETIACSNCDNCELLKSRSCSFQPIIGWNRCPYGFYSTSKGPTKRSKSCHTWVSDQKKKFESTPILVDQSPKNKYAYVGEYIYFPYAHATLNEAVPFGQKANLLSSGNCFLPKAHWNIETIEKIVKFRPQALFGGEITTYQSKEMPLFLTHLKEKDPDLYKGLLDKNPHFIKQYSLNSKKNAIGRTALLSTIAYPTEYTTSGSREGKYKVKWQWDGKVLRAINQEHAYNKTWGEFKKYNKIEVILEPRPDEEIVIQDESWVNENTKFVD